MRLLNVSTGKLEEHFGSEIPKYAILSHTWSRDEVTFSDIQNIAIRDQAIGTPPSLRKPIQDISTPATTLPGNQLVIRDEPQSVPEASPPGSPFLDDQLVKTEKPHPAPEARLIITEGSQLVPEPSPPATSLSKAALLINEEPLEKLPPEQTASVPLLLLPEDTLLNKEEQIPQPEASIPVPKLIEDPPPQDEEQHPAPEVSQSGTTPLQGSPPKNEEQKYFDYLLSKYRRVKAFYFEKKSEIDQLENTFTKHSWGRYELNNLTLLDGVSRTTTHTSLEGSILEKVETNEMQYLLAKYKKVKHLWFDNMRQLKLLQKALQRLELSSPRHDFPAIHDPLVQKKAGYEKIRHASMQAISDGYQYVWIDTCCIDKSSSTELSEAINSMFTWYQQASVCYAYVDDVQLHHFDKSRWFTRGWTLQELLAPSNVVFFVAGWTRLGTKLSLAAQITKITGIDSEILLDQRLLKKRSVAQRMSWASRRETTRPEDTAYCLLGIFGVNMPLLYGEGENAFIRLQEEIVKFADDQSLFAWSITSSEGRGIFAESPKNYQDSSSIISIRRKTESAPYVMTNRGLQIELPLIETPSHVLGLFDCQYDDEMSTCIAVLLERTYTPDVFFRVRGTSLGSSMQVPLQSGGLLKVTHEQALEAVVKRIYVPRDRYEVPVERSSYQIKFPSLQEDGFQVVATRPSTTQTNAKWNSHAQSLHVVHDSGSSWRSIAFVLYNVRTGLAFSVYFDEVVRVEGLPIEVWLSPLVDKPNDVANLKTWWHSLSYGIDDSGRAYPRQPAVWFRRANDDGFIKNFIIQARLEAANHFGQRVRIVHITLRPSTHPSALGEGMYSGLDIWMPFSLSALWSAYFSSHNVEYSSQPVDARPQSPPRFNEDVYSGLEVVPQGGGHQDRSPRVLPKSVVQLFKRN